MPEVKVLVPIGCRSDIGISAPIIRRLKEDPFFKIETPQLVPQNFGTTYRLMDGWFRGRGSDCDFILITGDRVEMCAAACAAFHNNIKIGQLYAGVTNDTVANYDDINRHVITLWSDIQFCENVKARSQIEALLHSIKEPDCHVIGITHLDDLEINEGKVPEGLSYNLILYNTPTKLDSQDDAKEMVQYLNGYTILVSGNPDGDEESVFSPMVDEFYIDLPRSQFLGLLKNCSRFITNSSSAIYEAPYFLKPEQIIMIGDRNRNRPKVECKPGGSDRIVKILKEQFGVR